MTISRKIFVIAGFLISLALIGTAIFLTLNSRSGQNEAGDSKTPLGGLFSRAAAVSQIKQQMGDLKAAHPALMAFAQAHQDDCQKRSSNCVLIFHKNWPISMTSIGNFPRPESRPTAP